jgi:uncharacterized membrane protein YdjX (TVP38/TMEM64 family)/Fe-S oxidoreductase
MKEKTGSAQQSVQSSALRPGLREALSSVSQECTECGLCLEECGFLKIYGTPKQIADRYDHKSREGQVMAFECSLCRLCDAVCPVGVNPREMMLEMRREAVDRGNGSFQEHGGLLGYERTGMSRRFTWYGLPEGCRTVLFPGCNFPGTRPEQTRDLYEMLRRQEPGLGIVLDCCGRISHDLGREKYFGDMFGEMRAYLLEKGIREVLVVCPSCYDMFRHYGDGLEVRTVYEVLAEVAPEASAGNGETVIHDPCGVRFHGGAHNAVRRLLAGAGVSAKDMDHARESTLCCGNGAGVEFLSPELSGRWAERSTKEGRGRAIVTYCAGCTAKLGTRAQTIHVLDVLPDPEAALAGKSAVSEAPLTFLNRLRIKRHFKNVMPSAESRERTFLAGREKKKNWAVRLLILSALIAAIVAVRVTGATRYLDQEALRGLIEGYGMLAPVVYMLIYTFAPALLLPGLPITIVGGILFGPFWGVVYTITSATAGACLAFLIARYVARGWVEAKLRSPRWRRLDEGVEKHGWKVVAFTRLIPLFPFNLLNYAFGMTRVGFWPYALTTFVCMLPACIAFIVFSSSLLDLLKGNVSANFVIGIGLIVLVSLIPVFYRRYRLKKGGSDPL